MQVPEQIPEKRMVKRLTSYWDRIRKDNVMPKIQRLNSDSIADVWPQCFMLKVESNSNILLYKYEYVGIKIVDAFGRNPTGELISSKVRIVPGGSIIDYLNECVKTQKALIREGRFVNEKDKVVRYRSCMLPFGNKNGDTTDVMVGLSWQAY